jgi:endonuclease-8
VPEGHTLHRLAAGLRERLAGRRVRVSSPQGRFADSAALLDGTTLLDAQAWGKHLFLEFDGERVVHVHLGLYGKFDLYDGEAPPPVGQVRLRLVAEGERASYADLRGATACELLDPAGRDAVVARLGPDPLQPEADPAPAWARIRRSRTSIAALLMDQAVIAGIGNVYRAELLFRHRVDPFRPGTSLRQSRLEEMWADLVVLMREGVRLGVIDTVAVPHPPSTQARVASADPTGTRWVYRRTGEPCFVCGAGVRTQELVARNLYWCPRCQPRFRSRASR